jgi:hypothetical protein
MHNAFMSDASGRLTLAREQAGFATAADAARALGMHYPTYAGHENGSRGFLGHLDAYARRFKVRAGWLRTGNGPMRAKEQPRILELFMSLSPEKQAQALEYIEFLAMKSDAKSDPAPEQIDLRPARPLI